MIFHMSQDQCIKALEEHAGIQPLVTLTGLLIIVFSLVLKLMLHFGKHIWLCELNVYSFCSVERVAKGE
jgi:hypothetical protein